MAIDPVAGNETGGHWPPVQQDAKASLALAKCRMPGLEGAIVHGADHIAAMAQPDDVNRRIVSFLQSELCERVHRAELRYG